MTEEKNVMYLGKIVIFLVSAVLLVAGSMFLQSCESEIDEFDIELEEFSFRSISEIPEGVIPLEFGSMREAKAFFRKIEKEEGPLIRVVYSDELEQYEQQYEITDIPRLRGGIEHAFNSTNHIWNPFLSITVFLSWDFIGGPIEVSSSASGLTVGFRWEQENATAFWSEMSCHSYKCIRYTIDGIEVWYAIIKWEALEISRVGRRISDLACISRMWL